MLKFASEFGAWPTSLCWLDRCCATSCQSNVCGNDKTQEQSP